MTFAPASKKTGYSKMKSDLSEVASGLDPRLYQSALITGKK